MSLFLPASFAERSASRDASERRHPPSRLDGCIVISDEMVVEDRDGHPIGVNVVHTYYRKRGAPVPVAYAVNDEPVRFAADERRDETSSSRSAGWMVSRAMMNVWNRRRSARPV